MQPDPVPVAETEFEVGQQLVGRSDSVCIHCEEAAH